MPRALGPPPYERPNWARMNEGQKRYAMEQWQLARVRRGMVIDHPVPVLDSPPQPNQDEEIADHDEPVSVGSQDFPDSPLFSENGTPWSPPEIPEIPEDDMGVHDAPTSSGTRSGPSPAKQPRMEVDSTSTNLPGTGRGEEETPGAPSQVGGEQTITIPRPINSSHVSFRVYKKVHRFLTFGLAYKPINKSGGTGATAYNDLYMITPLAKIPWEYPFMYINTSEFNLLPPNAMVEHMKCSVRTENVRIAFPTNTTATNLATLNQNKFLRVGKGLAQKVPGVDVQPNAFQDGQPMIVTDFEPIRAVSDFSDMDNKLYGHPTNDPNFRTDTPVHQFGLPYALPYYYAPVTQPINVSLDKGGWPLFQAFVTEFEADGATGHVIETCEYTPKMGLLKPPYPHIYHGVPSLSGATQQYQIALPHEMTNSAGMLWNSVHHASAERTIDTIGGGSVDRTTVNDLTVNGRFQPIEKSQWYSYDPVRSDISLPSTCPSLHVGLQPVPALTTSVIGNEASLNSFTDSQAYFEVTCEMKVKCSYPTLLPTFEGGNVPLHKLIVKHSTATANLSNMNQSMYHGLWREGITS